MREVGNKGALTVPADFRGTLAGSSGNAGRPASIHAVVISDADAVIESANRRSRIGRILPKNIVSALIVVQFAVNRRLVRIEDGLRQRNWRSTRRR